uniref:Y44f5a.1 n=1 Tax=Meloidogyne incognita TaxID=6306 RepID=A0A914M6M0_MELIC
MCTKIQTLEVQTPISSIAIHPSQSDKICLGFLDGGITYNNLTILSDPDKNESLPVKVEQKWRRKLKMAIRAITFSTDGSFIFVTASNRALCMFDTETGKRIRCIRQSHKSRPNEISLLNPSIGGKLHFATGAENGEVKMWDFRLTKPQIATFTDQDDIINSFSTWKNCLLSASGDGTLAAYDIYKRKLRLCSETMHSELLSLAVTKRFTYVGAADGYIEVFNNGEFGNIVERIETPLIMGVEQLETVRDDLLLAGASTHDGMRFMHVNPNKSLGGICYPDGIGLMVKSSDLSFLLVTTADGTKLNAFKLEDLVRDVPYLRAQDMHKFKEKEKEENKQRLTKVAEFFKDMLDDENDEGEQDSDEETEDNEKEFICIDDEQKLDESV